MNDTYLRQLLKKQLHMHVNEAKKAHLRAALLAKHAESVRRPSGLSRIFTLKEWKQAMKNRFAFYRRPVFATLGAALLLTTTVSAATAYWFNTQTQVTTNGSEEKIEITDCPGNKLWSTAVPASYDYYITVKIVAPEHVSKDTVLKGELAHCESSAIGTFIREHWSSSVAQNSFKSKDASEIDERSHSFAVTITGKVLGITEKSITVESRDWPNNTDNVAKQFTLSFDDDVLFADKGKVVTREAVVPGTYVTVAYNNFVVIKSGDKGSSDELKRMTDPGDASRVGAVVVRQTNPQDEWNYYQALGNRWIEVIDSNNTSRG